MVHYVQVLETTYCVLGIMELATFQKSLRHFLPTIPFPVSIATVRSCTMNVAVGCLPRKKFMQAVNGYVPRQELT